MSRAADTIDSLARALQQTPDRSAFVRANSLSRVLRLVGRDHPQEHDIDVVRPWGIVTAYVSELTSDLNRQRLRRMAQNLKTSGVTSYWLTGAWSEEPSVPPLDTAEKQKRGITIPEEALFCVPTEDLRMSWAQFGRVMMEQAERFEQSAILISDAVNTWVKFRDGRMMPLGDRLTTSAVEQAYKAMRGQLDHRFVFSKFKQYGG